MIEVFVQQIGPFVTGNALGLLFYGGLWWTVRQGTSNRTPALWFGASLLLRMALTMAGFLLIAHGSWVRAVFCLFGFAAARIVLTRLVRPRMETVHAP